MSGPGHVVGGSWRASPDDRRAALAAAVTVCGEGAEVEDVMECGYRFLEWLNPLRPEIRKRRPKGEESVELFGPIVFGSPESDEEDEEGNDG